MEVYKFIGENYMLFAKLIFGHIISAQEVYSDTR